MLPSDYKEIFGAIAAFLAVAGNIPYVLSTLRGKTRPHLFSWIIWAFINGIVAAAQYSEGAGPGMWVTAVSAFSSASIALLAVYYRADVEIHKTDWAAFLLGIAALALWVATRDPFVASLLSTFANLMAYVVVVMKIWRRPESEDALSYFLAGVKWIAGIVALEAFTPATLIYPGVFTIVNMLTMLLILWRAKTKKR